MKISKHMVWHLALFSLAVCFGERSWYFLLLTAAQLIFVPLVLHLVMGRNSWFARVYPYIAYPAFLAILILHITGQTKWDAWLSGIYLVFTIVVSLYGLTRFFKRGFAYLEECSIDLGMMYLCIGGAWYFAHEANVETGFSPIIRWLTGIHFHYSSFLLLVFAGLLGRKIRSQSSLYKLVCGVIFVSPVIVALGITFSRWLELASVLFYIVGIYGVIYLSFCEKFANRFQRWMIRSSFSAVGISILFSLLYALGNVWGLYRITIDFMILFHGVINSVGFAFLGLVGWMSHTPESRFTGWDFPMSRIRGGRKIGDEICQQIVDLNETAPKGLVDDVRLFTPNVDVSLLSPTILDFYQHTERYRLMARIHWSYWFTPFAFFYHLFSRRFQQLNLPISRKPVEMLGSISPISEELDGREKPRAWLRKVGEEVIFVALYSYHQSQGRTYMNISLPLPGSAMIGILEWKQMGRDLQITSEALIPSSDSGIYLTCKMFTWKLPLRERFWIREIKPGKMEARHKMWIFGVPFLRVRYEIESNYDK
ncbi:YndJ family protein [Thermoactinomyces sp. DSM 45892]|uniref:YndJ family protein n=1 Tax=Thermoactinomyces sp. DSM 45892 TaxID=1882753 RepID=UPI00089B0138|nr:YndJ family protein [Thermoactinomyces sp. DSM 45892]SDZ23343.1 YndJ-like protein [Thermoactinomyces sp. DSM 45892]